MYSEFYYAVVYNKDSLIKDGYHYDINPTNLESLGYSDISTALKALEKEKEYLKDLTVEEYQVIIKPTVMTTTDRPV